MSRAWDLFFRSFYRTIRLLDPLIRAWHGAFGLGRTVDLVTLGRRSGRRHSTLLTLLEVDGRWYVGHPNGRAAWTRNLEAAAASTVTLRGTEPLAVRAVPLEPGPEREGVIRATWSQQPFPGNVIYWLARDHVRASGAYYRLETVG